MKMEREKNPIPEWCKGDCYFRDREAEFMPSCTYPSKLIVLNEVCQVYRKEGKP